MFCVALGIAHLFQTNRLVRLKRPYWQKAKKCRFGCSQSFTDIVGFTVTVKVAITVKVSSLGLIRFRAAFVLQRIVVGKSIGNILLVYSLGNDFSAVLIYNKSCKEE